jgi:pSer/pThr/pTyr-binding forkhead associated (FHA) protein
MTNDITVWVIGRSNSQTDPDIALPDSEASVGRAHAELTRGCDGSYYIVDLKSANGTFIQDGREWRRIQQASVNANSLVKLGTYQSTVGALVSMARRPRAVAAPRPEVPPKKRGAPKRNPETGEIE